MGNIPWPEAIVLDLRAEIATGKSASQIAASLSLRHNQRFTRNAIIGKAQRLHIPIGELRQVSKENQKMEPKPTEPTPSYVKPSPPVLLKNTPPPMPPLRKPEPLKKNGALLTVVDLSNKTCKWPIGDPQDKTFGFCGHPPSEGKTYCEYHCRMAYTTAGKQKSKTWVNPRHTHLNFTK